MRFKHAGENYTEGVTLVSPLEPTSIDAAVVPAVSTAMATIDVKDAPRLFVELTVAVAALTGFEIKARPNAGAAYATLYSTAGDYDSPKGLLVGTSGNLTTQGVGTGWFIMDTVGLESVQLWATSGGTATLAFDIGG